MRLKVGHKLLSLREERKMSQVEFSEILSISPSAYARLERGETQLDFEELVRFSEALKIPLYELLPETVVFHNHNNGKGAGVIFGNYIINVNKDEQMQILENENQHLQNQIQHFEDKIHLLEEQLALLKEIIQKGSN